MGKFVVSKAKTGYKFNLKASNGQVIATSEIYDSEAGCKNGIDSVKKNALIALIEDQTVEGFAAEKCPKFEVYNDKAGEFRFRLKAGNGQQVKDILHALIVSMVLNLLRRMLRMQK